MSSVLRYALAFSLRLRKWRHYLDSRGVTTAEYALLLALVVVVLISSLSALGATLQDKLQGIIDTLTGVGQ